MKPIKPWRIRVEAEGRWPWVVALGFWLLAGLTCVGQAPLAGGIKSIKLNVPVKGKAGFTQLLPAQTGLNFSNFVSDQTIMDYRNATVAGVAVGDVDGDGLPDIFFCRTDGRRNTDGTGLVLLLQWWLLKARPTTPC